MENNAPAPPHDIETEEIRLPPSEALSKCLLSQYSFCAGGVGLGAAYGIKYSKGVVPMAVSGVVGTMADMAYGYIVACSKEVEIYNKSSGGEK